MSIGELELAAVASATGFSGVVRVDRGDRVEVVKGYRLADRSYGIANEVDTRFALASGTKGLTALPIRAPRLQLEHLTLLDHRVTSSIDNGIEESHPSRDDHPPQREGVDGSRPS